ncbi:MAG: hypothetical protein R3D56_03395 [Paracoccaceae bacterium]
MQLDQGGARAHERLCGLAYDRFRWRIGKDLYAEAGTLMLERSGSAGRAWRSRSLGRLAAQARAKEMREGDARRAYRMAANHHLEGGDDYADLEWLAVTDEPCARLGDAGALRCEAFFALQDGGERADQPCPRRILAGPR